MSESANQTMTPGAVFASLYRIHRQKMEARSQLALAKPAAPAEQVVPAPPKPAAPQPVDCGEPRYFGSQREPERPKIADLVANVGAQSESAAYKAAKKGLPLVDRKSKKLDSDPIDWRGRKVRKLSNRQTYTIKQVFRSGRVELERDWMTYLTDVETIRDEYEAEH
jgi:hypothetical protein